MREFLKCKIGRSVTDLAVADHVNTAPSPPLPLLPLSQLFFHIHLYFSSFGQDVQASSL